MYKPYTFLFNVPASFDMLNRHDFMIEITSEIVHVEGHAIIKVVFKNTSAFDLLRIQNLSNLTRIIEETAALYFTSKYSVNLYYYTLNSNFIPFNICVN